MSIAEAEKGARTVVIVDDNEGLVEIMKAHLEEKGCDVLTAHNGVVGLFTVERASPDLIILDFKMPRMDGLDFLKKLVEKHGTIPCPVLIVTAFTECKEDLREMKVQGMLIKPFSADELEREVARILGD